MLLFVCSRFLCYTHLRNELSVGLRGKDSDYNAHRFMILRVHSRQRERERQLNVTLALMIFDIAKWMIALYSRSVSFRLFSSECGLNISQL